MEKSQYVLRAEEMVDSFKLCDLPILSILRDRDYDFIVQYPPPLTMDRISGETIYEKCGDKCYHIS